VTNQNRGILTSGMHRGVAQRTGTTSKACWLRRHEDHHTSVQNIPWSGGRRHRLYFTLNFHLLRAVD